MAVQHPAIRQVRLGCQHPGCLCGPGKKVARGCMAGYVVEIARLSLRLWLRLCSKIYALNNRPNYLSRKLILYALNHIKPTMI